MSFKESLLQLLKTDIRLLDSEGELMGNKIQDLADKTDEKLIELLLDNTETRAKFFLKIKDVYVFKTSDFKFYIDENKIDNSYTQYENRIGLTSNGKFLKDSNDVVLDFPYKDCILEGGQSTEEGNDTYFEYDEKDQHYIEKQAKRKEIFFNQVLAKDEIDRLLEPKAFTNTKKYTVDGEENVTKFERDENGTIKDNLIIKGNNLLALHTLKKEFAGKVKLIYIDPPYNTGNDSFAYNDNFNHSTWLTFMRNRLLIAKDLLREDGVIMVQCSFHQFAYLKVLMNDKSLFKKHLCDFNIQVRHPDRALTGDKDYNDVVEYILIFSNNLEQKMPFVEVLKNENDYVYSVKVNENANPNLIKCDKKTVEAYTPDMYETIKHLPSEGKYKKISIRGSIREKNSSGRFFVKYLEKLNEYPPETLFKVPNMGDDEENHRFFYSAPLGNKNGGYFQGMPTSSSVTKKKYSNFYNFEKEYNNVSSQGGVEFRNGKKPEELIKFLIEIFSKRNDIILDYHLGSGTTSAVAHKMKRQFIGVEQMNSQIKLSINRLNNVIAGDLSGISEDEDIQWQGGGSFIYLELAKNNQNAIEKIQECKSYEELISFFDEMCEKYFLHYNVKIKQFREEICREENFKKLALEKQKEMFIKMLDLNQLYVNVSDMEDAKFSLSEEDIKLTKDFYQL